MNMADLRTLFRWDDPDRYEWVLSGSARSFLSRVGPVIGVGLIIPVISYIATGLLMLIPVFMYSILVTLVGVERFGGLDKMVTDFRIWSGVAITIVLIAATVYFLWVTLKGSRKRSCKLDPICTSS